MLLFAITFTWRIMKEAKDQRYRIRSFVGGSIGNLVEWYDWYAYSFFSIYFAPVFFPKGDKTAQLLNAANVFAVGFFMRPIGGWLFGRLADKQGRKKAMTVSVLLMSFGSLLIACTPGYETVGLMAPVILFTARLIQGLNVGGEYGTSATYLSEMATPERRGFYSSFQYVTLIAGQLVAVALQLSPCQVNGQSYLKIQMSRYCTVYAPYMSRLFKDAGHMRDICGTYAGHPTLCHRVSISHTKAFHLSVITCRHKGIRCPAALCTNERCLWRYRRIPWGLV